MNKDLLSDNDFELTIDIKQIMAVIWHRKQLIIKVFTIILLVFILSTFISTKKWKVSADLYINKANSTNYLEVNPYAIEEASGLSAMLSNQNPLSNELELIQSPLVLDKVILDNNIRYKKLFNIFVTKKTGEYITPDKLLKRKLIFENKKGTSIISISYTSKKREEAYNVVSSIINNYIELHKELNSEKSKSDKKVIENEYKKAKEDLNKKVAVAGGLPTTSMSGTGNLAAMGAFSRSAQSAMSILRGQYLAGEKARVEINEDATKVNQLANKLEWARLVEEMSDSSKVLVIKEPKPLKDWEYASPKLFTNILLGIVFGAIFSLMALIYSEKTDKKLSYSMLGDNIIYDLDKEFNALSAEVISDSDKKTAFIFFFVLFKQTYEKFKDFINVIPVKAEISNSFKESIKGVDNVVTFASIGKTDSEKYKLVKKMISNLDKKIMYEVLL